jgi:type I restriction enzyme S subunit
VLKKELPDGWRLVKLKEVAKIDNKAISPDEMRGELQSYIGLENIESNTGRLVSFSETLGDDIKSNKFGFTEEHILYGKLRPYLNKVYLPDFAGVCSTDIIPIKPDSDLLIREFLGYFLRTPEFVSMINAKSSGANLPRVNPKALLDVYIPLPPLETQRKIVAILEKAEATQRLRAEADVLTQQLLQNVYMSIFGDPISNPQSWDIVKLECVCKIITDGEHATPKRSQSGIYLLSARNIRDHEIDLSDVDYIDDEEYDRISKRIVPQNGDVLISCSGSVGRMSRVKDDIKFQMVRSVALIRPDNQKLNSAYLEYTFDTAYLKMQIAQSVNQSSQANLFQGKIRELKIPIPPMDLQQVFAEIVEKYEQLTESQRITSRRALTLYNSLLSKAFIGELIA